MGPVEPQFGGVRRISVSSEFNPFDDLRTSDPYHRYRELRDHAPVHWSPEAELYTVSRYEDVLTVLKDSETFSSEAMQTVLNAPLMQPLTPRYIAKLLSFLFRARTNPWALLKAGNLISLDGERHTALRKIVGRGFTPRRIADWQPRVNSIVEQHVARMRKRSRIDVIADLAVPLPTTVIAEMLGVEPERRDDFKHWSSSIISVASGTAKENVLASGVLDDITELFIYLKDVIQKRRESPRDDLISLLVDSKQQAVLGEIDIIQFVVLLLVAGNETTTNLIGNAANALLDHPRQLDRIIEDPSLISNLVEETLRFDSPLAIGFRNTTREVELHGVSIPKGKNVAFLIGSANRDERFFENPEQFDIMRDTTGHLGFGFGVHFCLGSSFARLQAQAALAALVPELRDFRRRGRPSEMIDSFLVRGRQSIELRRA
jgi:cytochrome P450